MRGGRAKCWEEYDAQKGREGKGRERNQNMHTIAEWIKKVHQTATDKGWHDPSPPLPTQLLNVHSEVSEASEALRRGEIELFREELADIVIRVFDICGSEKIDLSAEIAKKDATNAKRPYRHGGKTY
ncbi:MAG: hypothetical protein ABIJ57_10975 [Pseudomonadota bacterium]